MTSITQSIKEGGFGIWFLLALGPLLILVGLFSVIWPVKVQEFYARIPYSPGYIQQPWYRISIRIVGVGCALSGAFIVTALLTGLTGGLHD